jgi:hypothetical protein
MIYLLKVILSLAFLYLLVNYEIADSSLKRQDSKSVNISRPLFVGQNVNKPGKKSIA